MADQGLKEKLSWGDPGMDQEQSRGWHTALVGD